MSQTLPHNREKVFARSLNKIISELWRNEFLEEFQDPPITRKDAYIIIAGQDLNRADLFQAAPYITMDTKISTKALLRLRTQHIDEIPTHNHLYYDEETGKSEKTDYVDRGMSGLCRTHLLPKSITATDRIGNTSTHAMSSHTNQYHGTLHSQHK